MLKNLPYLVLQTFKLFKPLNSSNPSTPYETGRPAEIADVAGVR
jgi:hypothetical protein